MAIADILFDPGVLGATGSVCELQGFGVAAARDGAAVLPWRGDWLRAQAAGVDAFADVTELGERLFDQCVVHLQKSRPGTWRDLADGWQRLEPGGRLLLIGGNDLGIKSAVKRLGRELGDPGEVLANRAHGRVVRFIKRDGPSPTRPELAPVDLVGEDSSRLALQTHPGVFSADRLDAGTALLLDCLADVEAPTRIFDAGCGIGPLGIAALRRWPEAHGLLADADARAVACAAANADKAGVAARCDVRWWEATEPVPVAACELALVNPPFHYQSHKSVDLAGAHALFRAVATALAPGGVALVVANRSLPYEEPLSAFGAIRNVVTREGFKVIEVRRSAAGASG